MKEKNLEDFFDVRDFVGGMPSLNRSSEQIAQISDPPQPTEVIVPTESTEPTRRTFSKQRKASLDEYRELLLKAPKITDRQPVFVNRTTRDRIDDIVRRLGSRTLDTELLENLARHHLETYKEEVKQWKRL